VVKGDEVLVEDQAFCEGSVLIAQDDEAFWLFCPWRCWNPESLDLVVVLACDKVLLCPSVLEQKHAFDLS